MAVNSVGTVWVAYLQGGDILVQRSDDNGGGWSTPVLANAGIKPSRGDKPVFAVRDNHVYVAFNISQHQYASYSHNGGESFTTVQLNKQAAETAWTLATGGAVDSKGNVYFSWVGVHQSGNARGPQEVFLTKSKDEGKTWEFITQADWEDLPPGPDCSQFACGWDFWGPQMVVSVDAADNVYVAYNTGVWDEGPPYPPHVWFQAFAIGGTSWTPREEVHADGPSDAYHLFPAIEGGSKGVVHLSWMDNRETDNLGRRFFNVYYQHFADVFSDGGPTFGPEVKVNRNLGFAGYQTDAGFQFPFGDYYGMALDGRGNIHIAWGEGPDYLGPGNVFYARTR